MQRLEHVEEMERPAPLGLADEPGASSRVDAGLGHRALEATTRAHEREDLQRRRVLHEEGSPCARLRDYLQVSGRVRADHVHHGRRSPSEESPQEATAKAPQA